jgi:hypothetical protein
VLFTLVFAWVLNDRRFTVDLKLLELVAKHSNDRFALETFSNGLDNVGNCLVLQKLNRILHIFIR